MTNIIPFPKNKRVVHSEDDIKTAETFVDILVNETGCDIDIITAYLENPLSPPLVMVLNETGEYLVPAKPYPWEIPSHDTNKFNFSKLLQSLNEDRE